jgi:hypothetical protein
MALTRELREWLASLPRDREFSLDWAYDQLLDDHPKRAVYKSRASRVISASGLFDTWTEGNVRMFRYRGRKEEVTE